MDSTRDDAGREDGIAAGQDGRVYPVGRALRSTFDADNHDTLGSDLTGLMIDLSRVPFDGAEIVPRAAPPHVAPAVPASVAGDRAATTARGWLARIGTLLGLHT